MRTRLQDCSLTHLSILISSNSQVNDDGKITRLRKECREKSCPAATFMGIHYDRYSCGRCGLTLVYSGDD